MSWRIESVERKALTRPRHWASVILGGMALSGAALAAQADPAVAALATSQTATRTLYRVVNLGKGEIGIAINAKGQVAFTHADPFDGPPEAWFYDGAHRHQIGNLGGSFVRTTGLNDAGQVTGVSDTATGLIHSFIWSRSGGSVDIGTLPGWNEAWEPAINNRGELAGYVAFDQDPPYPHAFRWSASSGIGDLGTLVSGANADSYGRAINDTGTITGDAFASLVPGGGANLHAFIWTRAGGMVDIDTIGSRYSSPIAIGAGGLVGGNLINDPNNFGSIFWWTRSSGMHDLGHGNGQGTWMTGMSSGGRIVGVITYPHSQHALTWTQQHGLHDIGTLGGSVSNASAANNKGQVVGGAATAENAAFHAYVWTAREGMIDLNKRLARAPAGLVLENAVAISDNGAIVASSNAGLVLLKPVQSCGCGHAAGAIVAADVAQVGQPVDTSVNFTSGDSAGHYNVTWTWGDGTTERARDASVRSGGGSAQARHAYATPGIYTVTASVAAADGSSAVVSRRIAVVQPSAGMIGGSGTTVLPTSAGRKMAAHGGPAHFSFVLPSSAGANVAGAKRQFLFSLHGLDFASNDVRISALRGGQAELSGTGTVNGAGRYSFTATTTAGSGGGSDARLSVKIWLADANGDEAIVLDSAERSSAPRPVTAGTIVFQ
jgi:probable HAF family extracellular repeat protein